MTWKSSLSFESWSFILILAFDNECDGIQFYTKFFSSFSLSLSFLTFNFFLTLFSTCWNGTWKMMNFDFFFIFFLMFFHTFSFHFEIGFWFFLHWIITACVLHYIVHSYFLMFSWFFYLFRFQHHIYNLFKSEKKTRKIQYFFEMFLFRFYNK